MSLMTNETDYPTAKARRWRWTESYEEGIRIVTEDGKFKVFSMFHSGFGVATDDREMATQVCDAHNAGI